MPGRQEIRAEETRGAILTAAGQLFSEQGFETVTMREIAKAAGCSHTTIYIYFKDKEALLHHLSMGPLQSLQQQVESIMHDRALPPDARLKRLSRAFIEFCLSHRNMYRIFFLASATRVDVPDQGREVQRLRNHLFGLLQQAVQECLQLGPADERLLAYARILFFTLHGIVGTYGNPVGESAEQLMERLGPTFDLAVEVLLAGFRQTAAAGGERG